MKIMYLMFSFTVGGTERLVTDICNEMVKDNDIYLYIVNDLITEQLIKSLDKRVHINLQKRKVGGGYKLSTILKIANYVRQHHIEVIHCNSLNSPELLILRSILYRKTKIIYTIHDVGQYGQLSRLKIGYRNLLCSKFIAISESVKTDLINNGAWPKKVKVIYNAIDLTKFNVVDNKKFSENKIVIGNVARIMPEKKGQDILIRAISKVRKRFPNVICYFAGAYDDSHKGAFYELQESVHELCMDDNIVFVGNVDYIPDFLNKVDIFVLPSRFEGFGISLIEALAMGIPCIASNLDGPAEILGDNERGLLFSAGDHNELAEKIIYMIENYNEFEYKRQSNISYIHEHFDMITMCSQLTKIYKEV